MILSFKRQMKKGFTPAPIGEKTKLSYKLVRGFSLIELMVAVSILTIGIIATVRSMLSSAGGLNVSSNLIQSTRILEEKISELQEQAKGNKGIKLSSQSEVLLLNGRKANYSLEVTPIGEEVLAEEINEAKLSLSWFEDNKLKDEVLTCYFPAVK